MTVALKSLPVLALTTVIGIAAAHAADNRDGDAAAVEKAFGSTIVSTYPDGRQAELWLERGGTYTAEGRRHDKSSGTWEIKKDKLCLRQHRPFPAPFTYCTALPGGADQAWQGKAPTGEHISIKLVKGVDGRSASGKG